MNRVLIFGGAGFIGSHLASYCVDRGDEVHVAVRPQTSLSRLAAIDKDISIHRFEFADNSAMANCFAHASPQEIYQLATQTRWRPAADLSDIYESISSEIRNLSAILAAAASAKSCPRSVVRTGSLAEYGNGPAPYVESQRENPLNAYSTALVAATHCAQMLQLRLPFPVLTARLALTYGLYQSEEFLIPSLVRNCLAGMATTIRRPGDRRDMIYVTDVAEALCLMGGGAIAGGAIVNISTGVAPEVREIALEIVRATGANSNLIRISDSPNENEKISDSCLNFCASPLLARKLLGWKAKINLQEGLKRMLEPLQGRPVVSRELG